MSDNTASSKRVIKNTMFMYTRTLIIMLISLYTSRVVLQNLGITDYGTYSVVAGFVTMFSIISSTLTSSTQRFINFELGKNGDQNLQRVFSSSLLIHYILASIVLVLLETIGLWFLNYHLNIPSDRMYAANIVFQVSVLTFVTNIISIPYNALIIAFEKMHIIAYVGIVEAIFKILIAFSITLVSADKLILFSILMFCASIIVRIIYQIYCRKTVKELRFKATLDKAQLKTMFNFAGWNFIGSASGVLKDQGISIVLNLIYGVTINASRGVVVQVETFVNQFVSSFTASFNPQIVKSYASQDFDYMYKLVFNGSRFTFFLMLIVAFPIILNAELLLGLWLVKVPPYALVFTQLSLIYSLILSISYPLITLNMATGRIKIYQLIVGGAHFLNFPISYCFLKLGFEPYVVYIVAIILNVVCLTLRLIILKKNIGLPILKFGKEVLINIGLVLIFAVPIPLLLKYLLNAGLFNNIIIFSITFISSVSAVVLMGLDRSERTFMLNIVKAKLNIK